MKHALRKYLSPCGSALFMVVSTMAALVVLVTAMYMSVLSSKQVQFATFNQEQAYVSSTSISDIICSYIADGKNSSNAFVKKVTEMKNVGDSISTKGNGFASLSDTGTLDDTILGGYDVAVTKMKDEVISGTTWHVYDVAVTVSNNGILETTHTFMRYKDPEPGDGPEFSRFFTATGYVPNDVLVSGVFLNSTAYYDAEYVIFGDINSGYPTENKARTVTFRSGLICAGTAVFNKDNNGFNVNIDEPTDWYFGNSMVLKPSSQYWDAFGCSLGGNGSVTTSEERGNIFVGADLDIGNVTNFGNSSGPTDIYVLGDLNISRPTTIYGNIYVGGNINVSANLQMYNGGKLYHTNKTINFAEGISKPSMGIWDTSAEDAPSYMLSYSEAEKKLNNAIGNSVYPKWPIDENIGTDVRNIIFNGNYEAVDITGIKVVDYEGDESTLSSYYNELIGTTSVPVKKVEYIDSDCTIGDIIDVGSSDSTPHAIIFDTGAAGNTLTINLKANSVFNSADSPNGFTWAPAYTSGGYVYPHNSAKLYDSKPGQSMSIITVGDGNLVINVPGGVTFQSASYEFMGHYAWLMYMGGSYSETANTYVNNISDSNQDKARLVIHDGEGCSSCSYTPAKNENGTDGFTCLTHGGFIKGDEPEDCGCTGRIEKDMFTGDKYLYNGVPQKPNVNIFLVSNDESAEIQIGCLKYESDSEKRTIRNELYGYVYAPYMTYMDMSYSNAHGLKCCGGIIVSDYVMSGYFDYIFALPDMTLEELVGNDPDLFTPNGSRDWRIHGV